MEEESKRTKRLMLITAALVILGLSVLFLFNFSTTEEETYQENYLETQQGAEQEEEGELLSGYDDFAQCLTDTGVKMYGASWCGHCSSQKNDFGESWQYIDYVECSSSTGQAPECAAAGIRGYPTWVFPGGEKLSGHRSFEELSAKSGCALP